jgi:hypothetical protein
MNIIQKEWLYENDNENSIRYILGTKGTNPLICFGINPSTAEPENLDNTLKSVERLSINNGFDSWIMLNVYPQRATDPNGIHLDFDSLIHKKNLSFIKGLLSEFNNPIIWAAWGTLIEKRPFLMKCLEDIYQLTLNQNCNWVTFGNKSAKGHPHHPLYLSSTTRPEPFKIDDYVKKYVA